MCTQTRMMNQKKLKVTPAGAATSGTMHVIYSSSLDCMLQTVKTEGVMALYKGFIPNWLRLGPWNIIFFMTYEHLKKTY